MLPELAAVIHHRLAHALYCPGLPGHLIVDNDVVICAGATILGRVTSGRGSVIGGNVWVTHGVPPSSHVTQATSQQHALAELANPPAP